jgi:hypothetical protein
MIRRALHTQIEITNYLKRASVVVKDSEQKEFKEIFKVV